MDMVYMRKCVFEYEINLESVHDNLSASISHK